MHKKFNPRSQYCKCGKEIKISKLMYMRLLLFGNLSLHCKNCGRKHQYKLIYYVSEQFNKEINKANQQLIEGKQDVYKKG